MRIGGKEFETRGALVTTMQLSSEGFEFVEQPVEVLDVLRKSDRRPDLFTFMQRLPNTAPAHPFAMEWDNLAALPVSTFDHWWSKQLDGKTRNMVRRAEKKAIVVKEVPFDEALVQGIWEIYNECPVRQGRRFPHYGKGLDEVRRMSATFMATSTFIGAYLGEQLIGFMKLTRDDASSQAAIMHIIGMIRHRDKATTNALIAQGVKSCEKAGIPYLVYSKFSYGKKRRDSLSDFKENNGFAQVDLPRYYVPLTVAGQFALHAGLHHRLVDRMPEKWKHKLRELRTSWYSRRLKSVAETSS